MAAIQIEQLSFAYPLTHRRLRSRTGEMRDEIPVFSNFSLEVREGMRMGIVGPNGAGKTTLLKLIAGILPPSRGSLRVHGEVSSLLSISFGMGSDLTGIEHIWMRSAYMGRTRAEIEQRLPEIVEFAELGDFIDLPVNTYSSGMFARLAFSIATSFSPEILLLDESVSVGDNRFAQKATERFHRVADKANIMLLATHNERFMKRLCNCVLDLSTGEVGAL